MMSMTDPSRMQSRGAAMRFGQPLLDPTGTSRGTCCCSLLTVAGWLLLLYTLSLLNVLFSLAPCSECQQPVMNRPCTSLSLPFQRSVSLMDIKEVCYRLAPVESRRAGLRGGKPLDAPQASPDENRPSNDQSGAEDFQERADSEDDEASEQQAATSDASNGANVHRAYETGMHGAGQSDQQPTHFSQLYQPSMPSHSMQSSWPASNGSSLTYPLHT